MGVVWEGTKHHNLEGMVAGAVVLVMGTFMKVYYILADKAASLGWKWSPLITLKSHPFNNLLPVATINLLMFQDNATNWGPNIGTYGGLLAFNAQHTLRFEGRLPVSILLVLSPVPRSVCKMQ